MTNIKAVLWDIDSTLLDPREPEKRTIKKCFEKYGFGTCTDEMILQYREINEKWWDKMQTENLTKEALTTGRFEEFLSMYGLDSSRAAEFNIDYMTHLGDEVCPTPHALETVRKLHNKVRQYIVTNGLVLSQANKVKHSGIEDVVDGVFISEEVGADKPFKEFFDIVFEKTGLTKRDEIMIVGDSLNTDMRGGNNAGILSCWYNPKHAENTTDVHVDFEIDDIASVEDIINNVY